MNNHHKESIVTWPLVLAVAISGIGQTVAGVNWVGALLTGVCCGLLIWFCQSNNCNISQMPKWILFILFFWTGMKMLYILSEVENCWQPDNSKKFVPIVIMALASVAAEKGRKPVLNLTTILAVVCVTGLGVISVIAIPEVDFRVANQSSKWWSAELAAASLLPIVICVLPQESGGRKWKGFAAIAASVAAITLIINGVLSPQMAGDYENAFYEMSKTLSIMNLARRFEVVVASLMITGWFVTCAIYQSATTEVMKSLIPGKSKILGWILRVVVIGIYLLDGNVQPEMVLIADGVMIVAVVLCHKNTKEKIKSEKRY